MPTVLHERTEETPIRNSLDISRKSNVYETPVLKVTQSVASDISVKTETPTQTPPVLPHIISACIRPLETGLQEIIQPSKSGVHSNTPPSQKTVIWLEPSKLKIKKLEVTDALPTSVQVQLNKPFGKDMLQHSSHAAKLLCHILLPLLKSGFWKHLFKCNNYSNSKRISYSWLSKYSKLPSRLRRNKYPSRRLENKNDISLRPPLQWWHCHSVTLYWRLPCQPAYWPIQHSCKAQTNPGRRCIWRRRTDPDQRSSSPLQCQSNTRKFRSISQIWQSQISERKSQSLWEHDRHKTKQTRAHTDDESGTCAFHTKYTLDTPRTGWYFTSPPKTKDQSQMVRSIRHQRLDKQNKQATPAFCRWISTILHLALESGNITSTTWSPHRGWQCTMRIPESKIEPQPSCIVQRSVPWHLNHAHRTQFRRHDQSINLGADVTRSTIIGTDNLTRPWYHRLCPTISVEAYLWPDSNRERKSSIRSHNPRLPQQRSVQQKSSHGQNKQSQTNPFTPACLNMQSLSFNWRLS